MSNPNLQQDSFLVELQVLQFPLEYIQAMGKIFESHLYFKM